jgi:hypothetical protein
MAISHNYFKPRRSKRSGKKKLKLIKANTAILNKIKSSLSK